MLKGTEENIKIRSANGSGLAATLYIPQQSLKAAVMIGPATGIKRRFYSSFAQHLSENGYGVIIFDNDGIGDSLTGKVKDSRATLQSWGEQDMPAVLNKLQEYFPNTTYHLIGHSAGGQLVGLMHNARDFSSMFNFACSSGSIRNMKFPFIVSAKFFMSVYIPLNNLIFGFTNTQWVGMGERLPKGVAGQWSKWCRGKGYVKTAFGKDVNEHLYDELDFPSVWINATDDDIAIDENVEDMISVFKILPAERIRLDPKDHDLKEIGHMKFFSKRNKKLWTLALDWLNEHS